MKFIYLGMAILLSLQVYGKTLFANEAQASLMGRPVASSYVVPENLTPDEKFWFKVFQEGNMLVEGWQEISAIILDHTSAEQRQAQRVALEHLGEKIGLEWCRPNKVRKVTTSMLQDWGRLLRKTAKKNPQQLAQALVIIDKQVDAALD